METEPLVFVGIDWASTEHQVCLTDAHQPTQRVFPHDAGGIGAMVDWLCSQTERPDAVAVAIETPHGPVVEALMDRGIAVGPTVAGAAGTLVYRRSTARRSRPVGW